VRNAVLALAPRHPFAKVLINTGRLSVAPNLRGSWLLTQDVDAWVTPITPGNAAVDAPVSGGADGEDWLVHHLNGAFQLMVYAEQAGQIAGGALAALEELACDPVPVAPLIVLGERAQAFNNITTLHDREGLVRKRYDLTPGAAYLLRPDQHVCARWRAWRADTVRRAVRRSLGETVAGETP
jgi:3-(3-hydroxy-phenyl)propionate hydroxylase